MKPPFSFFMSFRGMMTLLLALAQVVWALPMQPVAAASAPADAQPITVDPAPLRDGEPQLILTKTIDDNITEAQVGDVIRYRIRWECSSLTTACGEMEITDVLQSGLTYLPPPASSVPGGFSIGYNSGTRTVTITKDDDNLLDGTQYDAVIVVRVNQDFRPLPAVINNTVNGRVDPPGPVDWQVATPASAPPISIGAVSPSWNLIKTRVAPVIEPTLDTDVTYQLRLCPVIPPSGGIADLTNIVLTDTLPANAIFISATGGGTESGGVVTWSPEPGPLSPPTCLTRFVTINYPSSHFSIGDDLTNSAAVEAGYIDSDGDPCPDCFGDAATEPEAELIDPVVVPTYSKSDAGDPVGITGTARFILNLNTNLTNYPANQVVMIDNMPPQLQVTSVTSGTWSEDFDYVRAYVEYSTNNGDFWTEFTGQPISYNTNATYSTGLPDNITNVRWRFEYDTDGELPFDPATTVAGLPYVWEFASRPEIRSTPRAVATFADAPSGAAMPVAILGETYTNCVYLTREDNNGAATDNCADEEITVQGDFASLRVSKDETAGTSWDEYEDPLINYFSSDATLLPGDTLRYVLRVELTERSSAPLVDPTILDTLPDDLIFVRAGDVRVNGTLLSTAYPAAVVNFTNNQPNGNPGANQTLQWQITNLSIPELELGSQVLTVEFFARIPRGQLPGTRTNELFVDTNSPDVICETGAPRDNGCETTDTYVVDRSAALRGEKWIRSVAEEPTYNSVVVDSVTFLPDASCPDGGTAGMTASTNAFTRFPCISQAYPEGALGPNEYVGPSSNPLLDDFEYQLRIFNDGNVPMLNYVLYDILPYFGDNGSGGTLASSARNSEFRPVMTGPIEFLGGAGLVDTDFTIEYNLSANPCRPEVFNQNTGDLVPAACNDDWFSTVADWSTVRSYRIRLNTGKTIAPYVEGDLTNMVRFGLPMSIPADSPTVGVFNNDDAQSGEIAWNSYSHVGSYQDSDENVRDLLASEPRKVGITIPERFSIGNRVWRDADNSGTINAPDDTNPGIEDVLVHLYLASDTNVPIATVYTDANGYYLFSNLPTGNYVVGIPAVNFTSGQPLHTLRSSTGTPSTTDYTNPPDGNPDSSDHGIDPLALGSEVFSPVITLALNTEPTDDTDLSANLRDGPAGASRGLNGERDQNSDLTVDFGFFGGTDVPFSIGNHLWYDNGAGSGTINDGLRHPDEPPVAGARVELYRDGNGNGRPDPQEYMRFDITDANGFYLFDNLDPGTYYVWVVPGNFQATFDPDGAGPLPTVAGPLAGWYSSQPSFNDAVDQNDNGINTNFPEADGVWSYSTTLTRGVPTPEGESHLSSQLDPGSPVNQTYNPTGWDGPDSRGRFGEPDNQSNLTIDFGFIPPMSLGNRVWIDDGAGEAVFRTQYNDGIQNGSEAGVEDVRVELWKGGTFIRFTTTDADGYYLFDRLQPGDDYQVRIPASNFASGAPLENYISSFDRVTPTDNDLDMRDKGIDAADPASTGISSPVFEMSYGAEPINDDDISSDTGTYGPNGIGNYGQVDSNSNLTLDFGFVLPSRSIGNYLWFDTGANTNNGIYESGDELPVPDARVSLYRDDDNDGVPDGAAIAWDETDINGFYLFDNLPPGRYLVGVDADNFTTAGTYSALVGYTSSTSHVDNAANNTDSLDNGRDVPNPTLGYGVLSTTIDLTAIPLSGLPTGETGSGDTSMDAGFNPTAGDGSNSRGRFGETDANSDLTIDFGFVYSYALGNRVWYDTNNNSEMDAGEQPVEDVIVELYQADVNGDPTGAPIASTTTNAGGFYLFDYLDPGDYVVVLPAANFTGAGELVGYWSSGTNWTAGGIVEDESRDPNEVSTYNDDRRDNGMRVTISGDPFENAVISKMVTLGPGAASEPNGEVADQLDPIAGQGNHPDERANMTVDFGFYRVAVGDLVFNDLDKDGAFNNADTPISGATVRLYEAGGITEIPVGPDGILGTSDDASGGMTTDSNGQYLFSGLPAGDYIISVQSPLGGSSTFDDNPQNDNDNPNWNVNNNDNGVGVGTGEVFSEIVTLTPGGGTRPDVSPKPNVTVTSIDGTTTDRTVDFGFVITLYSLGNRVWFDTNNDGVINNSEVGVNGVLVQLYAASDLSTVLATDTTSNGGYYLFDDLAAGDYVVVLPAANFAANAALEGYWSSDTEMLPDGTITEGVAPDPDGSPDIDSDDNGTLDTSGGAFNGAVVSLPVTLGPDNSEPVDEDDLEAGVGQGTSPDPRGNMTVDFGFYRVALGNLIFIDVNGNGRFDAGDLRLGGAIVQLFLSDGITEVNVGPDGILGTADDAPGGVTTGSDGLYFFNGLVSQGNYIVRVTPPVGYSSTVDDSDSADNTDPNANTDSNDNGVGEAIGQVTSNIITLTAGSSGAQNNSTINNGTGTTINPTMDFGFRSNSGLTKTILDTNEAHTNGDQVTIGEIVTYQVSVELPLGIPLTNVTLTDRLDKGFAFVDCLSVVVAGIDVTDTVCPPPPPNPPAQPVVSAITNPGDNPANPANPGRQVVFTIGDLPAQTSLETIVIQYRAVVLDVMENQNGVRINNSVTFETNGSEFSTSAPNVQIVEPFLDIDKSATPTENVPLGTPVQFTLEIYHTTPQSQTDAFDVIVTDILPANLRYVQCTVQYSGWAPNTPASDFCNPGTTTTDLIFFWDVFPLGEKATITFSAVLLGSPATNTASVEWTSLELDPGPDGLPIRLSAYNNTSHERWYDPPNGVDIYSVSDSVTINTPVNEGRGVDEEEQSLPTLLPATGFVPNTVTTLLEQPQEKLYSRTDIWVEIPSLGVKTSIVGVPLVNDNWDVSWLWRDAGWLNGTAFPGWNGNSALTGHVVLPDGTAGPFANLGSLRWGDRIIIHAYGSVYTYEVRENRTVSPYNTTVLKSEKDPWLTLITCENYVEVNGTYANRIAIRAVLVGVGQGADNSKSNIR